METPARAVALPLKGNEFQANHNQCRCLYAPVPAVALPLKGNEFQANHNYFCHHRKRLLLLLYLSKVTNFKQITTATSTVKGISELLLYLSKVTNFKQITTTFRKPEILEGCCFTSQR